MAASWVLLVFLSRVDRHAGSESSLPLLAFMNLFCSPLAGAQIFQDGGLDYLGEGNPH